MARKYKPLRYIFLFFIFGLILGFFTPAIIKVINPNTGLYLDKSKADLVITLINTKLYYDEAKPIINYTKYGIRNVDYVTCKDFAVSFAVLYATDNVKIVYNDTHMFNTVAGKIIEPQQVLDYYPLESTIHSFDSSYRIRGVDYNIDKELVLRVEDISIIKDYYFNN